MKERGFTLLELIIAFTILGLIVLIIGSGLKLGIRAWEKGELMVDESQRIRILYEKLSSEIRSAYPYLVGEGGDRRIAFEGKSESLSFVTSQADLNWMGGFKWTSYRIKDGVLELEEKRLPDKELDESKGKVTILDRGIKDIKFEFYEKKSEDWETSWDSKEKGMLPEIVKVTITLRLKGKEGEKIFPPLLISLPVAYNPDGVK